METIHCLAQWIRQLTPGDIKCAFLPDGCVDTTLRSTISQFNRGEGQLNGVAIHMSYFWQHRAACVICVSFDEYVEHKSDAVYVKNWRKQAKEFFDKELKKHLSTREENP